MRLDPAELPTPTDPIVLRQHPQHQSDAAWIARQRAREAKANEPPKDITGAMFTEAERLCIAAEQEHDSAQAAAIVANQRAIKASADMWEAREHFRRTALGHKATLARKKAQEGKTP